MRTDLAVYNEATGFTIHSASFCGIPRDAVVNDLRMRVESGTIMALQLVQDGSPHIRVVIGELTEHENEEWVDRVAWRLKVPCGELVFEGGFDPRGPNDDYMKTVTIPPGDYLVEVFTCYWGINGFDSLSQEQSEPAGTWFRRTRPGQEFPDTMKFHLGEFSEDDPGHEDEWAEFYDTDEYGELEEPDFVDFIVRLTAWEESMDPELQCDESGWFPVGVNPRKPALCPIGIPFER